MCENVKERLILVEISGREATVGVAGEKFSISFDKTAMLFSDGDPIYEDAEEFVMEQLTGMDEVLIEIVVPHVAKILEPKIEKYLP